MLELLPNGHILYLQYSSSFTCLVYRQYRVLLSVGERLRGDEAATQGVSGVPLPQVPECGYAQGGRAARQGARRQTEVPTQHGSPLRLPGSRQPTVRQHDEA